VVLLVHVAKMVSLDLTVKTESEAVEAKKVQLESVDQKEKKAIWAASVSREMDLLSCDKSISTKFLTKKEHSVVLVT